MSVIEVDLIQFKAGDRIGTMAVMVDYNSLIEILDLDGKLIIEWDGNTFSLDRAEWTGDMVQADAWMTNNPWQIIDVPDGEIAEQVEILAKPFRSIKPVVIGTHGPAHQPDATLTKEPTERQE